MMRCFLIVLVMIAPEAVSARAEPAPTGTAGDPNPRFALAANIPLAWVYSWSSSGWVALDNHQAIRVNVARHGAFPDIWADYEKLKPDFGATTDVGAAWVYYPRHVLDGASLEAGLLCRIRHTRDDIDDDNVASSYRHTNAYGGRALAGWTWRPDGTFFIAFAVGGSLGYERGTEKTFAGYDDHGVPMTARSRVSRPDLAAEAYLRWGWAFGG
jgi:hypothetical protein